MKIDLTRLSEQPLVLSAVWNAETEDLNVPGIRFTAPVNIHAQARRDSGLAIVQVSLKSKWCLTCARCFADFEEDLDKTLKLVYSLDMEEKIIDIDGDIREELMLYYPEKILCREDCKGLCPRCGADLNKEKCKCRL